MALPVSLAPASFRGFPFHTPTDDTSEGPNTIKHEYPDASQAYIEHNGYLPPEFNITALIHGPGSLQRAHAFRAALNRPAPGTLKHPWYGRKTVSVMGPYSVVREDVNLGVFEYNITFCVDGGAIAPSRVPLSRQSIVGQISASNVRLSANFVSSFVPVSTAVSIGVLSSSVSEIANVLTASFILAPVLLSNMSLINTSSALMLQNSTPSNAGYSTQLFADLYFNAIADVFESGNYTSDQIYSHGVDACTCLLEIQDTINNTPTTTVDYVERATALQVIEDTFSVRNFYLICESALFKTISTQNELSQVRTAITSEFERISDYLTTIDIINDIRSIYSNTISYLSDLNVSLPKVQTIEANEIPHSVLGYLLYESETYNDTLVGLNTGQDPYLFSNGTNILRVRNE